MRTENRSVSESSSSGSVCPYDLTRSTLSRSLAIRRRSEADRLLPFSSLETASVIESFASKEIEPFLSILFKASSVFCCHLSISKAFDDGMRESALFFPGSVVA